MPGVGFEIRTAEIAAVHYWPGTTWGRFDLALQHAQRAVELAPDKASGYVALGKIAELQENYTEAIAQYERAIEKEPQTYTGYLPLSETYSACGNLKQSLEMIVKASEVVTGINYSFIDACATVTPWLFRYYGGGIRRAGEILEKKNFMKHFREAVPVHDYNSIFSQWWN